MTSLSASLFDEIVSRPNLYKAAHAAARAKRYKATVSGFMFRLEQEIGRLHEELVSGYYRPGRHLQLKIYDPKERVISVAPFRDRVVHHAFHDVIEPGVDKRFIHDSYACRAGKGTHAALVRAQWFLRANTYCFHGDIRQYFLSIDHAILKRLLRRHVTDARVLAVLDRIIDSPGTGVGLPIGNLTSQFFANLYLHELDRFVKHTLRGRGYIRYMDDMLLFSNDKNWLTECRARIRLFCAEELRLTLHLSKSQLWRCREGVRFLGFRLCPGRSRPSSVSVRRFKRRQRFFTGVVTVLLWMLRCGREEAVVLEALYSVRRSVASWESHAVRGMKGRRPAGKRTPGSVIKVKQRGQS